MGLKDWLERLAECFAPPDASGVQEAAQAPIAPPGATAADGFGQRAKAAGIPEEVQRLYDEGLRLLSKSRWDDAAQAFASFLEQCPRMRADGEAGLARAARRLKGAAELDLPELLAQDLTPPQRQQARGHYQRGVDAQPDHPHCCAGLAQMLDPDELSRRLQLLDAACRSRPGYGVLLALGDAYLDAARPDDAIAAYQRALETRRGPTREAIHRLILLCEDLGRSQEAKRWRRELSKPVTRASLWIQRPDSRPMPADVDEQGNVRCPKCGAQFNLNSESDWSGRRHLTCEQRLRFVGIKPPVHPVWCITANIVGERPVGQAGVTRSGTRLFRPGTKVYCFPPIWGDGYEQIAVIGLHRKSRRFITCVVSWKHLTNWRAKLAYEPHVVDQFRWHRGWEGSAESKAKAEEIAGMMQAREAERQTQSPRSTG